MLRLSKNVVNKVLRLRHEGNTYSEINEILNLNIGKSTLSYWCSKVILPDSYPEKIKKQNISNLIKARNIALMVNNVKRKEYFAKLDRKNSEISKQISNIHTAKVALAMLCLGEAAKYGKSGFALGNSDPRIIIIFLQLLKVSTDFSIEKVRGTVQCRADQNVDELENYWGEITNIPKRLFYKAQIDPRTVGKPTKKLDYKGVFRVNYLDTNVQLELESLASLIYNQLLKRGPVV